MGLGGLMGARIWSLAKLNIRFPSRMGSVSESANWHFLKDCNLLVCHSFIHTLSDQYIGN